MDVAGATRPTVSVVIPARDDHLRLERCLEALHRQTVPADEIVVVDNQPPGEPARTALTEQMTGWWGIRYRREPQPGISAAAAAGYDEALGEIIARLDADSEPDPDWIERIVDAFGADPRLEAITGPGVFVSLPALLRRLAGFAYMDAYFAVFGAVVGHCPFFGSNFAMRRSLWWSSRWRTHRWNAGVHDDLDLSFCIPRDTAVRLDRMLRVPISSRSVAGPLPLGGGAGRGVYTLMVNRSSWMPGAAAA